MTERIRRLWRSLTPAERSKLRLAGQLFAGVTISVVVRWAATAAAVSASTAFLTASLVGTSTSSEAASCPPIAKAWLTGERLGGVTVERGPAVPKPGSAVTLCRPPVGVGHTIEGSLESGMSVFRSRLTTPHFVVGRDREGKVRIIQLVPLGEMGAALRNLAGGVETNRWARAQVELAGFSKRDPWLPDADVQRAYAGLMLRLRTVAGIPLTRPFPDELGPGVWATTTNPRRLSGKWGSTAGWFNHLEVPENDHWDSGALRYRALFANALSQATVLNGGHDDHSTSTTTERPKWVVDASKRGQLFELRSLRPIACTERLVERRFRDIVLRRVAEWTSPRARSSTGAARSWCGSASLSLTPSG
jgi:hypothetical protein